MKTKPLFDNTQAYREGWGLFTCDGGLSILKLDDPQSVDPSYPKEQLFKSDAGAICSVRYKANHGSRYHKKALKLHVPHPPESNFPVKYIG